MRWNDFAAAVTQAVPNVDPRAPLKINNYFMGGLGKLRVIENKPTPAILRDSISRPALFAAFGESVGHSRAIDREQSPAEMVARTPDKSDNSRAAGVKRLIESGAFSANSNILDDRPQVVKKTKDDKPALVASIGVTNSGRVAYPSFTDSISHAFGNVFKRGMR